MCGRYEEGIDKTKLPYNGRNASASRPYLSHSDCMHTTIIIPSEDPGYLSTPFPYVVSFRLMLALAIWNSETAAECVGAKAAHLEAFISSIKQMAGHCHPPESHMTEMSPAPKSRDLHSETHEPMGL